MARQGGVSINGGGVAASHGGVIQIVVIFLVLSVIQTVAFNVDVGSSVVLKGPEPSCPGQDCMFGFSVAQHKEQGTSWVLVGAPSADASQPGVVKGGAVYKCLATDPGSCQLIPFDTNGNTVAPTGQQYDIKSHQWFGSLVKSSGENGTVLACAPHYVWFSRNFRRREPIGTCFMARNNFTDFLEYSPCRTGKWGYHRQGSCQAGLGAAIANNGEQIFIGAVGSWYWQGQLFSANQSMLRNITWRQQMHTPEGPPEDDNSYLGYSVITGEFNGDGDEMDVAVGMPRGANLVGKVLLHDSNLNNLQNLTGEQIGAYFGYSLASCDINGDGLDDLIVGAPMWTDYPMTDKFETGRVYVVYQNENNEFRKWDRLDGMNHKARFGLSLASLGNINLDGISPTNSKGYQDFVVGAPYDGPELRGAVYIYLGSQDGVIKIPSQIIFASDVGSGIRTFGFSVAGGMDLDNNKYPDLVVGAYESGHAVHMRSAPVAQITVTVSFDKASKQIDLDDQQCTLRDGWTRVPCLGVTVTLRYTGLGVANLMELNLEYILDAKKTQRFQKRMFFLSDENKSYKTGSVSLLKDRKWEKNFKVYLPGFNIEDKLTPVDMQFRCWSTNHGGAQLGPALAYGDNMAMDRLYIKQRLRRDAKFSSRLDRGSGLLLRNPCVSKQSCSECLQTPTCAWCMQPDYLSADHSLLPRCNEEEFYMSSFNRGKCDGRYIINPINQFTILQNVEMRMPNQYQEGVQIMPQHVKLSLRVNEAFNMDFFYAETEDHPVDLYYLMDLSKSLEDDKEKLAELGDLLASTMQNITYNFRIGFGSFVDKAVMPFVSTVPRKLHEPCNGCAAPYGYKHHMSLSTDTATFAGEVKRAHVSGNLDEPEGGFDAIMQAIVCRDQIGWRDNARRLLVFATDAVFHFAGDGKLGGIVTPNDGKCHMDSHGTYTYSSIQDYPSVSQINYKAKENGINLIFAVTEEQMDIYKLLVGSMEGSSVGKMSGDSSNVVSLVKTQYEAITSSIEMKDNATGSVRVTYFSNCLGDGPTRQTNKCSGLTLGSIVTFTAKIEVVKCPKDPREFTQVFKIYPAGYNPNYKGVLVDLEMICQCNCEKPGNFGYEEYSTMCNGKGTYKCGICECPPDYYGRNCKCASENLKLTGDIENDCRPDNTSQILCNNRGDCICGKCECYPREIPEEYVSGDYCECDNFSCDRHRGLLCSGPDHGECVCGACICDQEWNVPGYSACECRASNETCITPYGEHIGKICSGHGLCSCGECICEDTMDGFLHSGKYCEKCPKCT